MERRRRPNELDDDEFKALVDANTRTTVREVAEQLRGSTGTIPTRLNRTVVVKCMIVPEHISVTGESVKTSEFDGQNVAGRERLMQLMNVPDRIVLTGGNSYEGFEAEPLELMKDHATQKREERIQDLPSVITLEHKPYLDRGEPNDEPVKSENSIAIEENPLQELKLMRRQIGRISTRLFQLEDELEKHRFREKISFSALFGIAAVLLMALLRR